MTNGRKTTFDERVEIVQYCISHGKDDGATIENIMFHISKYTVG